MASVEWEINTTSTLSKYDLTTEEYVHAQNEFVKNPKIYLEIQEKALEFIQKQKDSIEIKQKEVL